MGPGAKWTASTLTVKTRVPFNPRSSETLGISKATFKGLFHEKATPAVNWAPVTALTVTFSKVGMVKLIKGFIIPAKPMTGGLPEGAVTLVGMMGPEGLNWVGMVMGAIPRGLPPSVRPLTTSLGGTPLGVAPPKKPVTKLLMEVWRAGLAEPNGTSMTTLTFNGPIPPGRVRGEVVRLAKDMSSRKTLKPTLPRFMGKAPKGLWREPLTPTTIWVGLVIARLTPVKFKRPGMRYLSRMLTGLGTIEERPPRIMDPGESDAVPKEMAASAAGAKGALKIAKPATPATAKKEANLDALLLLEGAMAKYCEMKGNEGRV